MNAGRVNQAHPIAGHFGRNPVKAAIELIRNDFFHALGEQNGHCTASGRKRGPESSK
ncbi:hypothetical protein ACODUL_15185 [Stenotrophomonas maltophilia]